MDSTLFNQPMKIEKPNYTEQNMKTADLESRLWTEPANNHVETLRFKSITTLRFRITVVNGTWSKTKRNFKIQIYKIIKSLSGHMRWPDSKSGLVQLSSYHYPTA